MIRKIAAFVLGVVVCTSAFAVQKTWWIPRGSDGVALSGVNLVATTGVVVTNAAFGDSGLTIIVKDGNSLNSVSYSTTNLHDLTSAVACLQDDGGAYTTDTTDCNDADASDFAFPGTPAAGDRLLIAYHNPVSAITLTVGTACADAGADCSGITYKYLSACTPTWTALSGVSDASSGLTLTGARNVTFTKPSNAASCTLNSLGPYYWIAIEIPGNPDTDPVLTAVDFPLGQCTEPVSGKVGFEGFGDGEYQLCIPSSWFDSSSSELSVILRDTSSPAYIDWTGTINLNVADLEDIEQAAEDGLTDYDAATATDVNTAASGVQTAVTTHTGLLIEALVNLEQEFTADSGTTTTIVDAALTQATNDWFKGQKVLFTSSTLEGQSACITGFTAASDTLTIAPAVTTAVSTHNYYILPDAQCGALNTGAIAAATFSSGAIDATAIAADAIGASEIATDAIGAAEIATDAIGANEIAANAIGASELATDAIGAAELAADSITSSEIADNAIDAGALASDAITAAKIANSAIDAATFAADVDAEVLSYIVDDATRIDASELNSDIDSLAFGVAGQANVNVESINTVAITGDGSGTPFGVAWRRQQEDLLEACLLDMSKRSIRKAVKKLARDGYQFQECRDGSAQFVEVSL